MKFKPYDEYKDSGVEWIGKIPKDWEICKLKFLTVVKAQYGANEEPEYNENKFDFRYVRITDVNDKGGLKKDSLSYLSKERARGFILHDGDVLFARSGATVGKVYYYDLKDGDCCFAGYMIRYVSDHSKLKPKFLLYYSLSPSYKEWIKMILIQSTIENVSAEKYDNLFIPTPKIEQQNQIHNYLDKKTSEIDLTIEKDTRLIELLKEKRTALINHVVTKGMDPKANMKDSGVEWIGSIPDGWETIPFKRVIYQIKDGTHGSFERLSNGEPLLSAKNIYENGLKITNNESLISEKDFEDIVKNGFPKKYDLLLTIVGTIGRSFVYNLDYPLAFQRSVAFIRFDKKSNPCYYHWFVQSKLFLDQLFSLAKESAQKGVYLGDISNSIIINAPNKEQNEIITFLDKNIPKIDKTILKIQKNIRFLEEYKKSLIHHVVTGKVDVRGVAI